MLETIITCRNDESGVWGNMLYSSRPVLRLLSLASCLLSLVSCNAVAYREFQSYSDAFDAQYAQGDTVLQKVAVAEKQIWAKTAPLLNPKGTFNPDDAAYYLDNVEPPYTASLRATLKVIKSYNEAMIALASGENAKALSSRVSTLTRNVAAAVIATQVIGAGTSLPTPLSAKGADRFAENLTDQLVLIPVVKGVASIASRESFRTRLVDSHGAIHNMLIELRNNGTPIMYEMLREKSGKVGSSRLPQPDQEAQVPLAGWVMLLDKTDAALAAAVEAARNGSQFNLDTLSQASIELTILAEQVRAAKQASKAGD